MKKPKSLFSIDEICEAWLEFIKPIYLVDNKKITNEDLREAKEGFFIHGSSVQQLPVDYKDWIPFLIKWKKYQ